MQSSAENSHGSQGLRQSAWKKALGPSATTRLAAKGQRPEGWGDAARQGEREEALGLRVLGSNPSCAHFRPCDEAPTSLLCILSLPQGNGLKVSQHWLWGLEVVSSNPMRLF